MPSDIILKTWIQSLEEARKVHEDFVSNPRLLEQCQQMSQILIECFQKNNKAMSCGNGGSHCDAMHFAEEFTGRYRKDRRPLGAMALGDPTHMSCVGNDYGFQHVYERQVRALGRPGDVLLAISTSGQSENLVLAVEAAKQIGIKTICLLGRDGGKLKNMADLSIIVGAQTSDRIQEMHIKIIHIVIETIERTLFPENYKN